MSADVWIQLDPCLTCGRSDEHGAELNVTYNLSRMLREAGFDGWSEIAGRNANDAGSHILDILNAMATDPDRWRAMNPSNGWGDYDKCLQGRMRDWAMECLNAPPGATIGAWL